MASKYFFLRFSTISRRGGQRVTGKIAYNMGIRIVDSRSGAVIDFRRKRGVLHREMFSAGIPSLGTLPEREHFWNSVEARELRWDARVGREILLALPCDLTDRQKFRLVRRFGRWLSERFSTLVDAAMHRPSKLGDARNDHVHYLFPTRRMKGPQLTEKHRELDNRRTSGAIVEEIRAKAATMTNEALKDAGLPFRVDHRSYARQGVDRIPGRHMGPARTWMARKQQQKIAAMDNRIVEEFQRWFWALLNDLEIAFRGLLRLVGKSPKASTANAWVRYDSQRGLCLSHDCQEWLQRTRAALASVDGHPKLGKRSRSVCAEVDAFDRCFDHFRDLLKPRELSRRAHGLELT